MYGYGNSFFLVTNSILAKSNAGTPPSNTVAPVISGSTSLGSVLSSTTGTWIGTPTITYTYQWYRGATLIIGATNQTYTIVVADSAASITCKVTATNSFGSNIATSNSITAQTFSAPVNTVAPAITGTAQEGQTLTSSTGTWTGTPTITYTYQWKRNGSNIGSATNSTYTLVTADVSQSIKCTVTATNGVGSANADSNTVTPISSVDPDAQAFITAASITNPTQQAAINNLVVSLKGYSIWTKMKALYPFVGGTASQHKFNLKDPRDLDAAYRLTFHGDITHSSNGFVGGGVNGYVDTKLNTSTAYSTSTSISSGYYSRTNLYPLVSTQIFHDAFINASSCIQLWIDTLNQFLSDTFDTNQGRTSTSVTDTRGFFIQSRTASGQKIFRNNTAIGTTTTSGGTRPNLNVYLAAANTSGGAVVPSKFQCAFSYFADGLTDTEVSNLYTAVQAFQTTLSRNV